MTSIRQFLVPMVAAVTIGLATPVLAYDSGSLISMQQALFIASEIGLMAVSHTDFDDNQWKIEGRDAYGKYIEVDVDAATGEVRNVDR